MGSTEKYEKVKIPPAYDVLKEWIKRITEKNNWQELYEEGFKEILKKLRREEQIPEEELYQSILKYAENWPEYIKKRVKAILDLCPRPPKGPSEPTTN